ncbi:hypothetical protein [Tenacibaculum sp. 190524A05c]|uniref:hypothetical protein n=1 Tax=Tenacibaculum platacis TaxID=3137852 RepID=UPI0031FA8E4E
MNVVIGIKSDDNQEKFSKLISFLNENEIEVTCFNMDSSGGSIGKLPTGLLTENIKEFNSFTHKSKYHK